LDLIEAIDEAMKMEISEIQRSKLLRYLGEANYDYSELDRQKVDYVYSWLVAAAGGDDWAGLTRQLRQIEAGLKLKRRRLNGVYAHLKLISLRDCGRYDNPSLRPPPRSGHYDLGWRI
jgi:hypothetical protein